MDFLSREQFHAVAGRGRLVPVYRELAADLETPVTVYLKLRGERPSFLLESVENAEQMGRYSFLGFSPQRQIHNHIYNLVDGLRNNFFSALRTEDITDSGV